MMCDKNNGSGAKVIAKRWHEEVVGALSPYKADFHLRERTVAGSSSFTALSITIDAFVDPNRIVYYGLSHCGATALFVPIFYPRFQAIVCGGNFNEWIRKLIPPVLSYSYVHTKEYEIYEWNMANFASHAELAAIGTRLHPHPIPFLVERGHRDIVGTDEWVGCEFERLKAYVTNPKLRRLTFFDGEHRTDGTIAIPFLKEYMQDR